MIEAFREILFSQNYIPHGHCYLWQKPLVLLHASSDALIAIAYFSISFLLIYLVRRRTDLPFQPLFWLFGAFIVSCGITHLMEVWTLWQPLYWLAGFAKLINAGVSLLTAGVMLQLIPRALALPGPKVWAQTHEALKAEIAERHQAEAALRESESAMRQYAAQLQQILDFEAMLKRITDKVRDSLDESQIFQTAVDELGTVLGVRSCNAAVYDIESRTSIIHHEYTTSLFSDLGRTMQMDHYPELYAQLLQGEYLQFCSIRPHPMRGRVVMLACPIFDNHGILGDLWLINDKEYVFRDSELRLVQQVANQCAIAIRQARLYETAQSQVRELERVNQLKDDFLSTVSHELRTPMANIKMAIRMLELLRSQQSAAPADPGAPTDASLAKTDRYLKILQDECDREISLINDLLDLQRLEAQNHPLTFQPIDLNAWLRRVVEPFQERAAAAHQTLILQAPDPLPHFVSDPICLERILAELLNNACKYTPAAETITVKVQAHLAHLEMKVTNSGIEIAPAELPRVFEKFYRVPSKDPWQRSGTGLGLTLVQRLTTALNGEVQAQSRDNLTTFTVCLPYQSPTKLVEPITSLPTLIEVEHSS